MERLQFYVQEKRTQRADHPNSVDMPASVPSFVLVFNGDWNDYDYYTWFALWHFDENLDKSFLGELKLMCRDEKNTFNCLPSSFNTPLSQDYCSVGVSSRYYNYLQTDLGPSIAYEVLRYLRDCAVDISIREQFETDDIYRVSLMRDHSAERALQDAKLILAGRESDKAYSFNFVFGVNYPEETGTHKAIEAKWDVDIKYFPEDFNRIIGVIGENGVGKTTMLRAFVSSMVSDGSKGFNHKPLFNSLTVISSTRSDNYPKIIENSAILYSIHTLELSPRNFEGILKAAKRIQASPKLVNGYSKISIYRKMICSIVGHDADSLFEEKETWRPFHTEKTITLREEAFEKRLEVLSSGQLHIVAMTTYLIADMHVGALVIIDEPEVHLHPSSIVHFMLHLYNILSQFEGYCIIATHSPLIIREMLKENVYQFIRTLGNVPRVSKVSYDTFGEDISILYDRIFGYNENLSIFNKTVKTLIKKGNDRTHIEQMISSGHKMNLNARLRIFDMVTAYSQMEVDETANPFEDA